MNTAIALGIGVEGVLFLILGFVVALRAKRQFGFLAPLGFLCATLLNRICRFLSISSLKQAVEETDKNKIREAVAKLSDDDRVFYLGLNGHAEGIWLLGAMLFLVCGWLDLRAPNSGSSKMSRSWLIVGGTLFVTASAFYPIWMQQRIG